MRAAFAERHLGLIIKAYRVHRFHGLKPVPQEVMARWLSISQAQLSRTEKGPPIRDLDRLIQWAKALMIPPELLWFELPAEAAATDQTAREPSKEADDTPAFPGLSYAVDEENYPVYPSVAAEPASGCADIPGYVWDGPDAVRAVREMDYRALFGIACRHGFTPEQIAACARLPIALVFDIINGRASVNSSALADFIGQGLNIPDAMRAEIWYLPAPARILKLAAPQTASSVREYYLEGLAVEASGGSPERKKSDLWPHAVPGRELLESRPAGVSFGRGIFWPHSGVTQSDIQPVLKNMSAANALSVITALKEMRHGYLLTDGMIGALSVSGAVRTQIPLVERACEVTRGADRRAALSFACLFMEFCGWIHQDAGDLACSMFWTDRAFDYALELDDQRTIAYTLMRKAAITTEAGNPAQGLGIANFALGNADSLTPRLRAVILRQRAHAHATLHETTELARDADNALAEAVAGISQGEEDRAPYCSPMYVAMETGQSMVAAGQPEKALSVLAKSRSEWSDHGQLRDYALCVSRLASAYAAAGDPKQACATAEEALNLAQGMGSRRVIGQLNSLSDMLSRWRSDPVVATTQAKLSTLVDSFQQG